VTCVSLGIPALAIAAVLAGPLPQAPPAPAAAGPETFDVQATVSTKGDTATGAIQVPMTIQVDRYTSEHARTVMTDALKYGGYPGFLKALREAPVVGSLNVAGEQFVIRWARQQPSETGRTLSFVTDQPVFFVGSGRPGAKSTKGYEVAVVQLTVDKAGRGEGTMAAAARIKPLDVTGVQLDSYAQAPWKLTATQRAPK
jgi:hypothetical protein